MEPRTFFFAGKAAPAYRLAKLIIKFINNLAGTIDKDPVVRGCMKVVFLPEYNVSLAERLIPASDVSNQISTAGYEASGTSNMKFMMNGALTVGTRDGATIEMAEEAGEENLFLFGLTVEQVENSRSWYRPMWHYEHEPETRAAIDLISSNYFSHYEPGAFEPLRDTLLLSGDHYMLLADLKSYVEAQERLGALYRDRGAWAQKAILNVASSGKFLERPHDSRIHNGDLEGEAMPHTLETQPQRTAGEEWVSPLAGKPAPKEMLIDVARMEREYFEHKPDVSDPNQLVNFGTSGHRGSPLHGTFNEAHILAITQAICEYRRGQAIDGPLYMGKDTHAVSEPAQRTALEVLAANGVETIIQENDGVTPTPVISRAILVYNRGRKATSPTALSSRHHITRRGRRFQIQPSRRRPCRQGGDGLGPESCQRAAARRKCRRQTRGTVWSTDKDGLIMVLLAAEIAARTGKDPGQHYQEMTAEFGTPYYTRIDAPSTPEQKAKLSALSPDSVKESELAGEPVTAKLTQAPGNQAPIGGLKVVTRNGWFAARPSGTENIYKIYAESFKSSSHLNAIVSEAEKIVNNALGSGAKR
jgi:Carbohydrate phosphorylase/Phosphoglucomutase/phosphomannomutase, alpha/beta/alpha domain I/Phosphoglucomutase/phosphomannomutase, C-terminal domain